MIQERLGTSHSRIRISCQSGKNNVSTLATPFPQAIADMFSYAKKLHEAIKSATDRQNDTVFTQTS